MGFRGGEVRCVAIEGISLLEVDRNLEPCTYFYRNSSSAQELGSLISLALFLSQRASPSARSLESCPSFRLTTAPRYPMGTYGSDEDIPLPSPHDHPSSDEAGSTPPEYVTKFLTGRSLRFFMAREASTFLWPFLACFPRDILYFHSPFLRCLNPNINDSIDLVLRSLWLSN